MRLQRIKNNNAHHAPQLHCVALIYEERDSGLCSLL